MIENKKITCRIFTGSPIFLRKPQTGSGCRKSMRPLRELLKQMVMDNEQGPAKASLEDLKRGALEHYEHVSTVAHHWSSFVPRAIEAYREWVPIKDERPEKGEYVLIFEPSPNDFQPGTFFVSYLDHTDSRMPSNCRWAFPDFKDEQPGYMYPTHWMPLPPPPQNT